LPVIPGWFLATVAAYAAGTVVAASASSFGVLLAARAATGALYGIAVGSLVGGWAIASHGAAWVVLLGIVVCAAASPAAWATGLLRAPGPKPVTAEAKSQAAPPVTGAAEAACRNCRLSGRMQPHLLAEACPQGASPSLRPAERRT
jgi:hypothetical protein